MAKRVIKTVFERRPRSYYPTPAKAVTALVGHLPEAFLFCEPCAGAGDLVTHVEALFKGSLCLLSLDIEPQADWVLRADALNLSEEALEHCHYIITNPPFEWRVLQPMLDKWIDLRPTVLLLPADFMHNQRFSKYLKVCEKIVSIGRVKWIEGSTMSSVDNFCFYFFNKDFKGPTAFYGRDN